MRGGEEYDRWSEKQVGEKKPKHNLENYDFSYFVYSH